MNTPRTDEQVSVHDERTHGSTTGYDDLLDFARTLERELTALRAEVERLREELRVWREEAMYNRTFREQVNVAADQRNAAWKEAQTEREARAAAESAPALAQRDAGLLPGLEESLLYFVGDRSAQKVYDNIKARIAAMKESAK